MHPRSRGARLLVLAAAGSLVLMISASAGAAQTDTTTQGTIESVKSNTISIVTATGGHMRVHMTGDTRVVTRKPARLEDIKVGDFIGVTGERGTEGALTAVSINIFPSGQRGRIREGQWPMESGNVMTNAVVTQYVSAVAGRTLYLMYKDGTATIAVPPGTQVRRLTMSTLGDLRPGLHVTVRGAQGSDGGLTASSIVIEK